MVYRCERVDMGRGYGSKGGGAGVEGAESGGGKTGERGRG